METCILSFALTRTGTETKLKLTSACRFEKIAFLLILIPTDDS